jgi:tripartite-type tricarboxylate transporter receptor subunit TctC
VWWGMLAPAGTPASIVSRVDRDMKALLTLPEISKAFSDVGDEHVYQDSAGFRAFMINEIAAWKQVVQKANIKLD